MIPWKLDGLHVFLICWPVLALLIYYARRIPSKWRRK
jgi:hypothetical protein